MLASAQIRTWLPQDVSMDDGKKVTVPEFLLMFYVLCLSGNPFFVYHWDGFIMSSAVVSGYYIYRNAYKTISYRTFFIFFFLLGYELMHAAVYHLDYSFTIIKLSLVLLCAFALVHFLGTRFIKVLTRVMVVMSIISFIFTFLCYVPVVNRLLYNLALVAFPMKAGFKDFTIPTLLIYTFHPQYFMGLYDYHRNAGPFWESGAFASFLIVTLFLIYSTKRISKVSDMFDKQSTILVIAVVSTTSTMGFLALILLLSFFTWQLKSVLKYVLLVLIVMTSILAFTNVSYLGDKLTKQLDESGETNNRFGAALMDFQDIQKRPLIGASRRIAVTFGTQVRSDATRRPNGFTNFLRDYGLIYVTMYFALVFASYQNIFRYYHNYTKPAVAFFGVLVLCIISFSELLFDLVFFKALVFLYGVYMPEMKISQHDPPQHQEELAMQNATN
jgi:hypothetical protein